MAEDNLGQTSWKGYPLSLLVSNTSIDKTWGSFVETYKWEFSGWLGPKGASLGKSLKLTTRLSSIESQTKKVAVVVVVVVYCCSFCCYCHYFKFNRNMYCHKSWVWHENDFNPPPQPTANSISSISQLLLTRFQPNFKVRFLGWTTTTKTTTTTTSHLLMTLF